MVDNLGRNKPPSTILDTEPHRPDESYPMVGKLIPVGTQYKDPI